MNQFDEIAARDAATSLGRHLQHPDVQRPWSQWSEDQRLHVAVAYSNPYRSRVRRQLANDFRRHMAGCPNVVLHVGELAYGDRPHEVTGIDPSLTGAREIEQQVRYFHEFDVQLRTSHELWHKENILNRVIQTFPPGYKYGAYLDADFVMTRPDWALEAIHILQHVEFAQLFSSYTDLTSDHRPYRLSRTFGWNFTHQADFLADQQESPARRKQTYGYGIGYGRGLYPRRRKGVFPFQAEDAGAPGGGWCWRRSAFDAVGGLLDICIEGSADWHMAFGLADCINAEQERMRRDETVGRCDEYLHAVLSWQERAAKAVKRNIGCVNCHAIHHFHGSRLTRQYGSRRKIIYEHRFDPNTDIFRDFQGIYQLTGDKPRLRDALRAHFMGREDDNPNLYGFEAPL
jgi:hypothetical protein